MQKEVDDSWRESNTSSCVLPLKLLASILSYEIFQDEEEVESSTQSIQIVESLLAMNPSPSSHKVYEICDISSSHIAYPKEDIRSLLLKKNSPSILLKHSPMILLF